MPSPIGSTRMSGIEPPPDTELDLRLLAYLVDRLDVPGLAYVEPPKRLTGGYDAAIFAFRLAGAAAPFDRPLVLRRYRLQGDATRARREAAVQNALADLDFPAPRVFVTETGPALGRPFLIMALVPGTALGAEFQGLVSGGLGGLVSRLAGLPAAGRELVRLWDEAQARLQAVPVAGFEAGLARAGFDPHDFTIESELRAMAAAVAELRLDGLRPALDWLERRPPAVGRRVVCHGDLQPLNVMAEAGRLTGVIDWSKPAIAHPAYDSGVALAILSTIPIRAPAPLRMLIRRFVTGLARAHAGSCPEASAAALAYFGVFNGMVQLLTVARTRAQGNWADGAYNSAGGVANLVRFIRRASGVAVGL